MHGKWVASRSSCNAISFSVVVAIINLHRKWISRGISVCYDCGGSQMSR